MTGDTACAKNAATDAWIRSERRPKNLWIEVTGQGAPPLVLLNGAFCSTAYFRPMIEHFSTRHAVVSWDYPGHGRSEDVGDPRELGIGRLADEAVNVASTLNDPAVVIGHSMGVRVALELYARQPAVVRALVLVCGSVDASLGSVLGRPALSGVVARALGSKLVLERAAERMKQVVAETDLVPQLAYAFGGMCRKRTPRAPVEALLRNIARMDAEALLHLGRSYVEHSARHLLADVGVPTLIIAGERDRLASPRHCEGVARALREAEVWVAPGCTHLALIEDPEGVNRRIDEFVERFRAKRV